MQDIVAFVKKELERKIFVGVYTERKYIEFLQDYKDAIIIHESERKFINSLKTATNKMNNFFGRKLSVCIESFDETTQILSNLSEVTFGSHWFMVNSVELKNNVLFVNVQYLRPYAEEPLQTTKEHDLSFSNLWTSTHETISTSLAENLTKRNVVSFIRFVAILVLTTITGCYQLLVLISEFIIKFSHEFSNIITAITPILTCLIEAITKIIGGFFVMIAVMWTGGGKMREPNYRTMKKIQ